MTGIRQKPYLSQVGNHWHVMDADNKSVYASTSRAACLRFWHRCPEWSTAPISTYMENEGLEKAADALDNAIRMLSLNHPVRAALEEQQDELMKEIQMNKILLTAKSED